MGSAERNNGFHSCRCCKLSEHLLGAVHRPDSHCQLLKNRLCISATMRDSVTKWQHGTTNHLTHIASSAEEMEAFGIPHVTEPVSSSDTLFQGRRHFDGMGEEDSSYVALSFMWRLLKKLWKNPSSLFCTNTNKSCLFLLWRGLEKDKPVLLNVLVIHCEVCFFWCSFLMTFLKMDLPEQVADNREYLCFSCTLCCHNLLFQ